MKKIRLLNLLPVVVLAVLAAQSPAATTIAYYRFEGTSGPYIDETGNNNAALAADGTDLRAAGGANNLVAGGSGSLVGGGQPNGTGAAFSTTAGTTLPQWADWGGDHTLEFSYLWNGGNHLGQNLIMGSNGGAAHESTYWLQTPGVDKRIGIDGRVKPPGPGDELFNSYVDLGEAQNQGVIGAASVADPTWVDVAIVFKMNDPAGNKAYINGVDVTGTSAHTFDAIEEDPSGSPPFSAWGIGGQAWNPTGPWDAWTFTNVDEVRISWGERTLDDGPDGLLMGSGSGPITPITEVAWKKDVSGDFNLATNWMPGRVPDGSLGEPNDAITTAIFGDAITSPQTVFTNSNVLVTQVTFLNSNRYAIAGTGSVNFVANSVLPKIDVFVGNHEFQAPVNLNHDIEVTLSAGTSLAFNNTLSLNDYTLIKFGGGNMNIRNDLVTGSGVIDVREGSVSGNGTIGGNLVNAAGEVAPGNSPGILSVDGNYTQAAGGTLEIELAANGGVAGTDHDRLAVTLAASLDGTLDLQLDGGYMPTIGDSFAGIVTAGALSGNFATASNVVIDGRRGVAVTYTGTTVDAQIGLRGNTDIASGDSDVDTSDLTTSIINFTSAGGTGKTWADGDTDGDGDVDTSDLTTSIINFTSALSANSAAVPEPSSIVLLSLGMILLMGQSRMRRWLRQL